MSKVSIRRLLSRLTAIALSTTTVGGAAAAPPSGDPSPSASPAGDDGCDLACGADLPIDREAYDEPTAAARLGQGLALALALGRMRPLGATQLASTWALSEDVLRRHALAHALEWAFPLVGDALVLDHLSRDPDPAIRVATARAAWIPSGQRRGSGVLSRLAADPDPEVRSVASGATSPRGL